MKLPTLNKWLIKQAGGTITGLCLADTFEDAEDWAAELGLEGEIMSREAYEATTEGATEKSERESMLSAMDDAESDFRRRRRAARQKLREEREAR